MDINAQPQKPGTTDSSDGKRHDAASKPIVRVQNLVKHFRRGDGSLAAAVDNVSFDVYKGEFLVLLGPSGCGKTTLLRAIAGLEAPDSGSIQIRDETVYDSQRRLNTPVERRGISMIFQSYALWPHMTVRQNVAYPLQNRSNRLPSTQITESVDRMLDFVRVRELAGQYPSQMSGGQQQRVALARALVAGNDLILFDEPLSNVDAKVREQLRFELVGMQRELGFSAIYVTHDQTEAMGLAHRIVVMGDGKVRQIDTPRRIYDDAQSRYVASFVGISNELAGTLESLEPGGIATMRTHLGTVTGVIGSESLKVGDEVVGIFRPERGVVGGSALPTGNQFKGVVEASLFLGSHTEHNIRCEPGGTVFRLWSRGTTEIRENADVVVGVDPINLRILPK